jgi:hypothetical protein
MPISIVKDVIKRCNAKKLRSWEVDLKKERKLSCRNLGEAVASIVEAKIKKQGKFSQLTDWEMYQSLSYVDPADIKEISMQYGGGSDKGKKKKKKNNLFELKGKEVFAAGNWKGDEYTEADLDGMILAFDELDFKPALKIHHEHNDENKDVSFLNPALGKISRLYRKGKKLLADFCEVPQRVHDAVVNRAYDRVSSEIAWNFERNGKKFKRVLTAVSLLGSDIPAVANLDQLNELYGINLNAVLAYDDSSDIKTYDLKNDGEDIVVEFGGPLDWEDTATSYIYWMNKFDTIQNQIDNVDKEDLGDGVNKLFKTREIINDDLESEEIKDIVGWEFMKSDFNLAQAKAWINKRKDPDILFSEEEKSEEFQILTKKEAGFNFPKAAFAFVPDPEDSSTWKIRLWETPEKKMTRDQVNLAVAAFNPGGFSGNKVQMLAEDVKKVKGKVRAAFRKVNPDKDVPRSLKNSEDLDVKTIEGFFWNGEIFIGSQPEYLEDDPVLVLVNQKYNWNGMGCLITAEDNMYTIEAVPESAGDGNNDKQTKEDKMADEKLKAELEALQKKLADSESKVQELETEKSEFEAKSTETEEQEKKFSEEKAELEAKLKEEEDKIQELSDEKTKLEEQNKEFAEKEAKAREEARSLAIQKFVDEKVGQGKLLPRSKELAVSLLSVADNGEKVCKYSLNKETKESTVVETFKDFIDSMPRLVEFNELSNQDPDDKSGDFHLAVQAKIKESEGKLNYVQAAKIVTRENSELYDQYQADMFTPVRN